MKQFVSGILIVLLAAALASAAPRPEETAASPAVAETDSGATSSNTVKQNPIIDGLTNIGNGFNNFLSNIPSLPNVFAAPAPTQDGAAASAPAAPGGSNVLEGIQQALNPANIADFLSTQWNNLSNAIIPTTQATKGADATTTAAPTTSAAPVTSSSAAPASASQTV